ncbi:c-type heme family protein [Roseospira goensis]|uniref:Protein-histidine pros-kinase n=1 Tax=Roseospira goensis TaxID=391922 RepID=A0A7W6WJP3_9PROT|nr:DUF3365 domain-containing protein [Roseospira goensis]MBB4285240.1 protein-histidine pros-kinase [Roseospira goensis]
MGLGVKFNLVLLGAFAIGLAIAAALAYQVVQANARAEVLAHARIMMANAIAVREYTATEIRPLLGTGREGVFLPHVVPSFAAQSNFRRMADEFPEYAYKEAALNPTNPADRATDWEADIIRAFRQDPAQAEIVTERDTPSGRSLVLARPLTVDDASCLDCHSTPEAAPAAMVATYGPSNGFGWELGETVGAQVVSVPMALPLERAWTKFLVFVGTLTVVFVTVAVLINVLLNALVIRPVVKLSRMADTVSLGKMDAPEVTHASQDEIGALAAAFNRMRRSLETALRMLGG